MKTLRVVRSVDLVAVLRKYLGELARPHPGPGFVANHFQGILENRNAAIRRRFGSRLRAFSERILRRRAGNKRGAGQLLDAGRQALFRGGIHDQEGTGCRDHNENQRFSHIPLKMPETEKNCPQHKAREHQHHPSPAF